MKKRVIVGLLLLMLWPGLALAAGGISTVTWDQLIHTSHDFQSGYIVGMFAAGAIWCPAGITGAVIQSAMEGRVSNGLNAPSDTVLQIFAQSAASVGCRYVGK